MLRYERDYILRLIAAAAATVARLRERLVGGTAPDAIVREAQAAQTARAVLLQIEAEALRRVGQAEAAKLLERKALSLSTIGFPPRSLDPPASPE